MVLRMPRFNMSDDEATQLVNYFGAVSKVTNSGAGITYPYFSIPQRDDSYWESRNKEYLGRARRAVGTGGLAGSGAFFAGPPFLPLTTGVSANMSPPGNEMLRWRARRSTNWRATTSSIVLEALFTSMP